MNERRLSRGQAQKKPASVGRLSLVQLVFTRTIGKLPSSKQPAANGFPQRRAHAINGPKYPRVRIETWPAAVSRPQPVGIRPVVLHQRSQRFMQAPLVERG